MNQFYPGCWSIVRKCLPIECQLEFECINLLQKNTINTITFAHYTCEWLFFSHAKFNLICISDVFALRIELEFTTVNYGASIWNSSRGLSFEILSEWSSITMLFCNNFEKSQNAIVFRVCIILLLTQPIQFHFWEFLNFPWMWICFGL